MPRIEWVEARNLSRSFGEVFAVRGISARFEAGSISVLEGPNGAGKSTLLGMLGTTLSPTEGTVWYAPFGCDRVAARRELGWVSHEGQCYSELTVAQNLALSAKLRGIDPEVVVCGVGQRFGLGAFLGRRMGELSRGQRQRVSLARALAHGPSLLLLDEPWTGLEAKVGAVLEEVVAECAQCGAIVIVVSHDATLAGRIGAKRIRVERGRLVG